MPYRKSLKLFHDCDPCPVFPSTRDQSDPAAGHQGNQRSRERHRQRNETSSHNKPSEQLHDLPKSPIIIEQALHLKPTHTCTRKLHDEPPPKEQGRHQRTSLSPQIGPKFRVLDDLLANYMQVPLSRRATTLPPLWQAPLQVRSPCQTPQGAKVFRLW